MILIICCLGSVCVLAYFGFVSGLSSVFMKQKDLGVEPDDKYAEAVYTRIGFENTFYKDPNPKDGEIVYSGQIEIDDSLSSVEITSLMNTWEKWESTPFENAQARINDDGSVEFSAMVDVNKLEEFAKELGYTDDEISEGKSYLKVLNNKMPVYAKGEASMENNEASIDLTDGKIGNFPVPGSLLSKIAPILEEAIQKRFDQVPNTDIESVKFEDGKMKIKGDIPQKVEIE